VTRASAGFDDAVPPPGGRLTDHARRLGVELVELNERIARLAISLGARLGSEADVQRILDRDVASLRGAHAPGDAGRHAHQVAWEELRGLLNMRCDLMARALEDLGLEVTRQLTVLVEQSVVRDGFAPGADGFHMLRWLNGADADR